MKKTTKSEFSVFVQGLTDAEQKLIKHFFAEFDLHFLISKKDKKQFRTDFEAAIMLLYKRGVAMEEILSRLALSNRVWTSTRYACPRHEFRKSENQTLIES